MNYYIVSNQGFISEAELYHHGIRGMKWGVRRYQNEDGTLTAAGRKRYVSVTTREDSFKAAKNGLADADITTKYRERVMSKYETKKNDAVRKADAARDKAYADYNNYVAEYRKNNRRIQTKHQYDDSGDYDYDYNHTKKGRALIKAVLKSDEVRSKAYAGAKWYERYYKELLRAEDKDFRSDFKKDLYDPSKFEYNQYALKYFRRKRRQ